MIGRTNIDPCTLLVDLLYTFGRSPNRRLAPHRTIVAPPETYNQKRMLQNHLVITLPTRLVDTTHLTINDTLRLYFGSAEGQEDLDGDCSVGQEQDFMGEIGPLDTTLPE